MALRRAASAAVARGQRADVMAFGMWAEWKWSLCRGRGRNGEGCGGRVDALGR